MLRINPSPAEKAGDKAKDGLHDLKSAASLALTAALDKANEVAANSPKVEAAKEAVAPRVEAARDAAAPKLHSAKEAAAPLAATAAATAASTYKDAKKAAAPKIKDAKKAAGPKFEAAKAAALDAAHADNKGEKLQEFAGLTRDQAHSLFSDEWMPRIQTAIATAAATAQQAGHRAGDQATQAYLALPPQAQDVVDKVVPAAAKKRKKKGTVLIVLGLAGVAAGGFLIYDNNKKKQERRQAQATVRATQAAAADTDKVNPVSSETDGISRH